MDILRDELYYTLENQLMHGKTIITSSVILADVSLLVVNYW